MPWHRHILVALIVAAVRLLACTWRYRVHGLDHLACARRDSRSPLVMILHGRIACVLPYFGRPDHGPNGALVSRSRDGALIMAVLERFGYLTERGSSHRGGARALIDIVRTLRRSPRVAFCFAVDGSRGPRGYLKPGVLMPAQRLGTPLFAVAAAPCRAIVFRTWDRLCLPLPFTTVAIYCSPAVHVPPTCGADDFEHWRCAMQGLLQRAQRTCQAAVGYRDREPLMASTSGRRR